jgi:hypothetical protein
MYKGSKDSAGPGPALMGADTLIGDSVVNASEEDLGDIKEIMIDMRNGQVAYAVLAFGGFLGMGEKLFAVPFQALQLDTVNKRFMLNVDKDRLQNAPGFDPDAWPDMSDVSWAAQIHTFYGTDPNASSAPSMGSGMPMGGMMAGTQGAGAGMSAGAAGSSTMGSGTYSTSGSNAPSGAGAGMSSGAAGSSGLGSGSGVSGSSGLGAGTGSGAGGDLGSSTAAGTGSGSGAGSSTGVGSGSGTGTGLGSGSSSGKTGGSDI